MRKFIGMLFASFILGNSLLLAYECDRWSLTPYCLREDWPSPINVEIGAGFRRDKFEWSIAGPDDFPNVLSELKWKDLRMATVEGAASYVSCRNYAVAIAADYGHIYHGKNIDSDFLSDDEEDLFSRFENNAGRGHMYDLSAGVGYRVMSTCKRFIATPMVGYSHHAQYLRIYDGDQVFDLFGPPLGEFPGLNSRYNTRWFGPWIGFTFSARVESCAYVFGGFNWHIVLYRAKGRWNLRDDIGPFHHESHGLGYTFVLGGNWEIWDNLSLGILGRYRFFKTRHGHENDVFFDPIDGPIFFSTRFNGARWVSGAVSGMLMWRF
jgi:hypothetical protein